MFYIIRQLDNLGRIVIPKEIRKELNIKPKDQLKIEIKDNKIILRKEFNTDEEIKQEIERLKRVLKIREYIRNKNA